MELVGIIQARASAFIELSALDPKRTLSPAEIVKALFERYAFAQLPKMDSLDLQKGITFSHGKLGKISIVDFTLFPHGIAVDTGATTDDSEIVLLDFLESAHNTLGANILVHRRIFNSQVAFRSNIDLAALHPILHTISERLAASVSRDLDQTFSFYPVSVSLNVDTTQNKLLPASFTIERRADIPFSEHTYFSNAPLRTTEHLGLIQQFESALSS